MKKRLLPTILVIIGLQPSLSAAGIVAYAYGNHMYYIQENGSSPPVDITARLNKANPGNGDGPLNVSPNVNWFAMNGRRLQAECRDWPCLIVMDFKLNQVSAVKAGGRLTHPNGFSAISSNGKTVVYSDGGSAHSRDLWKVVKTSSGIWQAPVALTAALPSRYAWNSQPAMSSDGAKALFDCGPEAYAGPGSAICEIGLDGKGFRVVVSPADKPSGQPEGTEVHHADYAEGGVVFEADWGGKRLWCLAAGAATGSLIPKAIRHPLSNDNSPCVLRSGQIASLWLSRPASQSGLHELKIMGPHGYRMLVVGKDIDDVGLGCGG